MKCLIEIQSSLHNGESVRVGVLRFLKTASPHDSFAKSLRRIVFAWDQGQEWRPIAIEVESPHRRALIELIIAGFMGQSVLPQIEELKKEMTLACEIEMKHFVDMLPLKMLVPLLIFQFPAFLLLLFGPLLSRFIEELNR